MRTVYQIATVDEDLCCGDEICVDVCPTGAIKMADKIAVVAADACAACRRCEDVCPKAAITMVKRDTPMALGVFPEEIEKVDRAQVDELCQKAGMAPNEPVCLCTLTRAKDIAAVILMGAKTPREVSLMTGVRTYCAMWCSTPVQRLLKAHGHDVAENQGRETYPLDTALWTVSEKTAEKYPEYRIEEDKKSLQNGTMDNIASNMW